MWMLFVQYRINVEHYSSFIKKKTDANYANYRQIENFWPWVNNFKHENKSSKLNLLESWKINKLKYFTSYTILKQFSVGKYVLKSFALNPLSVLPL